jgi:hypothetical protein
MTEAETVAALIAWLEREGWSVGPGPDKWLDVYATRGDERLHIEAKGATKDNGVSADIAWGQILRRMTELGAPGARYALAVPESIKSHVLRVPLAVRQRLGVELFVVADNEDVRLLDE